MNCSRHLRHVLGLLLIGTTVACHSTRPAAEDDAGSPRKSVVIRGELDPSVRPADDFFDYVNRKWIAAHPIPADQSAWGVDYIVEERVHADLRAIAEELQSDAGATGDRQRIRDFYATAMDEKALQREGIAPLKAGLDEIAAIRTRDDLARAIALAHVEQRQPLFAMYVAPDERRSDVYSFHLAQGGTALPERSYYVDDDERSKLVRATFEKHVGRMFRLLGDSETVATAGARVVMGLETRLAQAQMGSVELRDVEKQYHPMPRAEAAKLAPTFNWDLYFQTLGVPLVRDVVVGQPAFMARVEELLRRTPMEDWRTYLRWHLVLAASPCLSDPLVQEHFDFYGKVLSGAEKLRPRWRQAMNAIDANIGQAMARVYVDRHFGPQAKRRVNDLVDHLIVAYGERIRGLEWMGPATKERALAKLAAVRRKLAYPDAWRDYSKLEIRRGDSYLANSARAWRFESRRQLDRVGGPVDRDEWGTTAPTVNAYYDPSLNDICFPAGILQAPYFDPDADDALNYGAIGSVIGHELTHGFDDQGCKFDGAGNMVDWWTAEDKASFDKRAKRVVEQYGQCVAVRDVHVNGELTLGENIADLGGLVIAIDAYKRATRGKAVPEIDGFTGMQRFFIGYAISWRETSREEKLLSRLRVDPHSPEKFRVNVPLSNLPAFIETFGVKPGDRMWRAPADRETVW